ncbi:MAG: hypothetical protein KC502_13955 [Myxococcales bacterium]|nr:hypothetical protein [Myxococcales bacterium]
MQPFSPLQGRMLSLWIFALILGCDALKPASDPTIHLGETVTTACVDCHKHDYDRAESPNHAAAKVSTTCETCHEKTAWKPAKWEDHQTWPLTGKHVEATCAQCHSPKGVDIAKPPRQCSGCHQPDYDQTTNPKHTVPAYPLTCESCHKTTGWKPASWDHSTWPLTGEHKSVACASCHAPKGIDVPKPPTDCVGCHKPDYDQTTNPKHTPAQFPTTCKLCHTTAGWVPAGMTNHDFPITSGKHNGVACSSCHTTGFQTFSCIDGPCHNKTDTDDDHNDEGGYVYKSSACYSCHPDGKE